MSGTALGADERAEVLRFRSALTLDSGASFHVVVATTRRVVDQALTELGLDVELLRPAALVAVDEHEHAEKILRDLDTALARAQGRAVVLDAVVSTPSSDAAWRRVFQRLNERRSFTESRSSGPLIFCVSPRLETALGHEAPDLWSKRGSGMRLIDRTPNRVFVSYADDSPEHVEVVRQMAEALGEARLWVFLDREHEPQTVGWNWFVKHVLGDTDRIVCVCTPTYQARLDGEAPTGHGPGATWEAAAIRTDTNQLGVGSDRFVLVHVSGSELAIPQVLGGTRANALRWPEDRESLLTTLGRSTARTQLVRCLQRAFGDERDALDHWAAGVLTWRRAPSPNLETRTIEIADAVLRMGDPHARTEALASLAPLLGDERAPLDALADELGLGTLPPPRPRSPIPPSPSPVCDEELSRYLAEVVSRHQEISLVGIQTKVQVRLSLEALYVPLYAITHRTGRSREVYDDATDFGERAPGLASIEIEKIALTGVFYRARALGRHGCMLLGDPGSGKTTRLQQILLKTVRQPESLGLPPQIVPVFLALRNVQGRSEDLWAWFEQELESYDASPPLGPRLRERGNLLLLLDGLDEVASAEERVRVSRWIEQIRRTLPDCFVVVSCRYAGYTSDVELGAALIELHLWPLDDRQMRRFVTNWYGIVERAVHSNPRQAATEAARRTEDLLGALSHPDITNFARSYAMTRNPLLLTAICLVHRDRGQLPRSHGKLYEECIQILLERWERQLPDTPLLPDQALKVLLPIAYWMHERGRTRATADELRPIVAQSLSKLHGTHVSPDEFLRAIRDEGGPFTGWGIDDYGFMHLGLQEYLTARWLHARVLEIPAERVTLARRFGDSWWQEVILLLLGLDDPIVFEEVMRAVVEQPDFPRWAHSELMTLALTEVAKPSAEPFVELVRATTRGQAEGIEERQLAAAQLVARAMPQQVEELADLLRAHPSAAIRLWWRARERGAAD
ncbi:MAG: NACHT domain-containing protein [Myxococcota bacterium]